MSPQTKLLDFNLTLSQVWKDKIEMRNQSHKLNLKVVEYSKGSLFPIRKKRKQAGAELGQAQLKLGLGFTSTDLH